jgi:acetylornithine deacetylase
MWVSALLLGVLVGIPTLPASAFAPTDAQPRLGEYNLGHTIQGSTSPSSSSRADLLSLHRSLAEISSITGNESAVGNFLVNYLTTRGYTAHLQFLPSRANTQHGSRFNVIAWPGDSHRPEPRLLVSSHIDVVPPYIPYSISDEKPTSDTIIRGRGTVDAKGSIAAQVMALQSLLDSGDVRKEDVMLLFVVGEEGPGDGMRYFSNETHHLHPPPEFESAIFGEPTENKLACGHKGGLFGYIEARGTAGHSGYPWLGKSANELLIRALAEMLTTDLGSSDKFGNTTVNVGKFDGGIAANVIPEYARADVAIRIAIGPEDKGADFVADRVQSILDGIDPDAFNFVYSHRYGVVETNCDVEGEAPRAIISFVLID